MKYLIVVDMQNDFVSGSLGSAAAEKTVSGILDKVKGFDGKIIFTRDTHFNDYLQTQEGKNLPVSHCIKDTDGWQIVDELSAYAETVVDKSAFGSMDLPNVIGEFSDDVEEIQLCGLCTDICVISNAVILKSAFPEAEIVIDSSCCAGVSETSHNTALDAMRALQMKII